MVPVLPIDILGLPDLIVGFPLDVVPQFLFVDHPTVVLGVVAMNLLFFAVLARRQPAIEPPLHPLHLVLLQLVPN